MKTEKEKVTGQLEEQENSAQSAGKRLVKRAAQFVRHEGKALFVLATMIAGAIAGVAVVSETPIIKAIGWNWNLLAVTSALYDLPRVSPRFKIQDTVTVHLAQAFRAGLQSLLSLMPDLAALIAKVQELWRSWKQGP
jgi:hypothetical protein